MSFRPMSSESLSGVAGHALLQAVFEHLQGQVASGDGYIAIERLAGTPEIARVAWYIWCFVAEAGGSGIPGYLANHVNTIEEIRAFRNALVSVEATEVLGLLDAALALEDVVDALSSYPESDWLEQFKGNAAGLDWELIERRSFDLLSGPLSELAGAYIKQRAEALC